MPCYLFTYHGYGTWMPDRKQGYVKRHQGILATDVRMATIYKKNLKAPIVCFGNTEQLVLLDELETACIAQGYSLHHAATDESHAHVLVSWKKNRKWQVVRAKLGESMTRRLNLDIKRRQWFAKSPSRKRVENQEHFDYLTQIYLPNHRGWKWRENGGKYR